MRLAAILLSIVLSGCGAFGDRPVQDQLQLVVDVATLRVDRTTNLYTRGVLPVAEAQKRLKLAQSASEAMQGALKVIVACEGQAGKCDLAQLRRELGGQALDRLEEHLIKAGDFEQAEAVGAARIVYTLMQGSATPGAGDTYSDKLAPLVARFEAAISRLQTALASKA